MQKITQKELAERANIDEKTVCRIMTGKNNPNFLTIISLARLVDKDFEQFAIIARLQAEMEYRKRMREEEERVREEKRRGKK